MEALLPERVTLPASRISIVLTLFMILSLTAITSLGNRTPISPQPFVRLAPSALSSATDSALLWLARNQSVDGSYGAYQEHLAAAAAYALWLNSSNSPKSALSYSWLGHQLNSSQTWFWGQYGEADVPGSVLFSLALSSNLHLVNTTIVAGNLLQLQKPNNGFEGYFDGSSTVATSVDTDMALLGLINARAISVSSQTYALDYVLSLQNPSGSFNLTSSKSFDPFYSLGPDPISITALTLLVLKSAGFAHDSPSVSSALSFLNAAASSDFDGHVYAAALSALALKAFNEPASVVTAVEYILSQQNSDGGFSDSSRSSPSKSNALDTGLAAVALEEDPVLSVNSPPTSTFVYDPASPNVGVTVHFDASSSHDSDGDQLAYQWTFGDGSSAAGLIASHSYSQPGNFTITLIVTDSGTNPGALSNTKSETVTVKPANVQTTSRLPFSGVGRLILLGIVALVLLVGAAVYLVLQRARRPAIR
jgi:PKD repeat protein